MRRERLAIAILGLSTICHALAFLQVLARRTAFTFAPEILLCVALAYACHVAAFLADRPFAFGSMHAAGGLLSLGAIALLLGRTELAEASLVIPFIASTAIYLRVRLALGVTAVFAAAVVAIDAPNLAAVGALAALVHLLLLLMVMCATAGFGCLLTFYRELIVQNGATIRDMEAAVTNLANANKAFQTYADTIETTSKDDERNRITRELHDVIGYALTNLIMMMNAGETLVRNHLNHLMRGEERPTVADRLHELFENARLQADSTLQESRKILYKLRSITAPRPQGIRALEHLVRSFQAATGVAVTAHYGNLPWSYGEHIDNAVLRLVQEGLTNSFKHGRARNVRILLWQSSAEILVRVWDDGKGAAKVTEGIGLTGMKERFAELGGRVEASNTAVGFVLDASIPMGQAFHESQ